MEFLITFFHWFIFWPKHIYLSIGGGLSEIGNNGYPPVMFSWLLTFMAICGIILLIKPLINILEEENTRLKKIGKTLPKIYEYIAVVFSIYIFVIHIVCLVKPMP